MVRLEVCHQRTQLACLGVIAIPSSTTDLSKLIKLQKISGTAWTEVPASNAACCPHDTAARCPTRALKDAVLE